MKNENDLIKDIVEYLDQSAEDLDPGILSRIRAARYNALEKKQPGFMQWAFPAGGIAAAVIVLFVAVTLFTGPENRPVTQVTEVVEPPIDRLKPGKDETIQVKDTDMEIQPDQVELVEMLSSDQQLDLFENLDFYAWLAENENISG